MILSGKISLISEAHNHYDSLLQEYDNWKKYCPVSKKRPSQDELEGVSFCMTRILKFDNINQKKEKNEVEYQAQCGKIKDDIKKLKLKISLT